MTRQLVGQRTSGKFRLTEQQGLKVLSGWLKAVNALITKAESKAADVYKGLELLGARAVFDQLRETKFLKGLSLKELYCYMQIVSPVAFNGNVIVPFGPGSIRGACMFDCTQLSDIRGQTTRRFTKHARHSC